MMFVAFLVTGVFSYTVKTEVRQREVAEKEAALAADQTVDLLWKPETTRFVNKLKNPEQYK